MANLEIEKFMNKDEIDKAGLEKLDSDEIQALLKWGLRMFTLGQHHIGDIEEIKCGGRLIILDDGSR